LLIELLFRTAAADRYGTQSAPQEKK